MRLPFVSRKHHDAEVARLTGLIEKALDPSLLGIEVHDRMLEIGLKGGAAHMVAGMFVELFKGGQATNYVEIKFGSDIGPIVVHCQRLFGKTPVDLLPAPEAKPGVPRLVKGRDMAG